MRILKAGSALFVVALIFGSLNSPAKADTFYATLVPMTTAVTLTSSVTELTIGTKTTLTYGGGDGTGGYRFNNRASSFCSVDVNGVVSANYPGQCSFTVTRLASGKYIDTTSSAVSIMALPEPDKSIISTPEPDPTPTPRATRSATPTPTAAPISAPAPVVIRDVNEPSTTKVVTKPLVKKVSGVKAELKEKSEGSGFKFSWKPDVQAISYSVTLTSATEKKNFESKVPSIDVTKLLPGTYTMEVQAIDSMGKLSTPTVSKFVVPQPTTVRLTAMVALAKPEINAGLTKTLNNFILQTTLGYPVELVVEYPKGVRNSASQAKIASELVTKYLKDKKPGTQVTVTMKALDGSWDFATIRGSGKKQRSTLLISRG